MYRIMPEDASTSEGRSPEPQISRRDDELWRRLEELLARVQGRGDTGGDARAASAVREATPSILRKRGVEGLSADEVGELGRLYRAATTRLAQLQSFGGSQRRLQRFHWLVARAHAVVYGRPPRPHVGRLILNSFRVFPLVVRQTLPFHVVACLLLAAGGLYGYFGAAADPEWATELVMPGDNRTQFADREELLETLMAGREGYEEVSGEEKAFFCHVSLGAQHDGRSPGLFRGGPHRYPAGPSSLAEWCSARRLHGDVRSS